MEYMNTASTPTRAPLAHRRGTAHVARVPPRHHAPGGPSRPPAPARRGHAAHLLRPARPALAEAPRRRLRMTELAMDAKITRSRLSHAIARLEKNGWVRREDCPSDKRGQFAVLTDEGFEVLTRTAPGHVDGRTPGDVRPAHARAGEDARRDHADHRRRAAAGGHGRGPALARAEPRDQGADVAEPQDAAPGLRPRPTAGRADCPARPLWAAVAVVRERPDRTAVSGRPPGP